MIVHDGKPSACIYFRIVFTMPYRKITLMTAGLYVIFQPVRSFFKECIKGLKKSVGAIKYIIPGSYHSRRVFSLVSAPFTLSTLNFTISVRSGSMVKYNRFDSWICCGNLRTENAPFCHFPAYEFDPIS
jgi:hypothetical protein